MNDFAATPSSRMCGGSGGDHGSGQHLPHGEGPHDSHVEAEGTLPDPKDWSYHAAVESLLAIHNGDKGRPPLHWPAPLQPRSVPPTRTRLPRSGDLATVTRWARTRQALGRITRKATT